MQKQLDHALVLFIESVKNNVLTAAETKNANVNKNASVLQQLGLIYKWLNTPESEALASPEKAKYKLKAVLPDNSSKLFGSRTAAHNMRKHIGDSLNISTDRPGKHIIINILIFLRLLFKPF